MLTFLKYLLQLILAPKNGWDDIAERNPDAHQWLTKGLYPLMALSAATEFLSLAYDRDASLLQVVSAAITDFGAYFLAIFIARLILDLTIDRVTDEAPDRKRIDIFIIASTGLMVLFQIIDNCLPWHLMLLKFLPLYVVLVISKAFRFMNIRKRDEMSFLTTASLLIVAVPLGIYYLIYLLIR